MKSATIALFLVAATLAGAPIAAAAQSAGAAAAAAPDVYKPAGQWTADYGDDYCRLARNFSDGTNTMALALERIQPGPDMRLIFVGPDLKLYRSAETIGWHFLPGDAERQARATRNENADGKQWYNFGLVKLAPMAPPAPTTPPSPPEPYDRSAEQALAKGKTGILLDASLTSPVQIETGDLAAPIAALQACADDLAKTWGLDPAALRSQKSPVIPVGGGTGWLPQGTVGFADFAKLGGGSNLVRLVVDATGKPTSCAIHWATLDPTTNDKICKALMDKGRFTPAKDANGQPMAGYWVASPMFLGPPLPAARGR
jgi:hypothetical protein